MRHINRKQNLIARSHIKLGRVIKNNNHQQQHPCRTFQGLRDDIIITIEQIHDLRALGVRLD